MDSINIISEDELVKVNAMLANVHIAIAQSMSYVRKFQGWEFAQLEHRISGVKEVTWRRYFRTGYDKMRPIHTVAAYSWLTMLPMACFYRGLNIREAYPNMDDVSTECLIHSGLLPKNQFDLILSHLHHFLSAEQQHSVHVFKEKLNHQYGSLDELVDDEFMFPETVDIDAFGYDYYYSLAVSLKDIRERHQITIASIAQVLNLSEYRYRQLESPDNPVPLPVELGARLQIGLRLPDAMIFTRRMTQFPQFHTVRRVQQIRQNLLVEMLSHLDPERKKNFAAIVANLSSMYLNRT